MGDDMKKNNTTILDFGFFILNSKFKIQNSKFILLAVLIALNLARAGCGGGGGGGGATGPDIDGDGIPNAADAFPNDPTRFAAQTTLLLAGIAGGSFSTPMAISNANQVIGLSDNSAAEVRAVRWTVDAVNRTVSAPALLEPLAGNFYSAS